MSTTITILGTALLALLFGGYVAQKYLPDPPPKIGGIDLGTTFSSIALYHAVTGQTQVIGDRLGRKSIPSVVAFLENGTVLVGHSAVSQSEHNPLGTIYDAKRFIGKRFTLDSKDFNREVQRYSFKIKLHQNGSAYFEVPAGQGKIRQISPEQIGKYIIEYLRAMVLKSEKLFINKAVISVPAEFDDFQRNATKKAATLAGMDIYRVISEPTAAALAYGLHKKDNIEHVVVIDVGGGTLDVSVLWLQGPMFVTRAMAGNNRLGGQDFNERILRRLLTFITTKHEVSVTDKEDLQNLRLAVESAKIRLTNYPSATIDIKLHSAGHFHYELTRHEFEAINDDLFLRIIEPIEAALNDADITKEDIDEIVLVGGSTRIPKIRRIVGAYFSKSPNFGVDPELAVVTGVGVQAGVVSGGWPLQVSAVELATNLRKIHVYNHKHEKKDKDLL